MSLTPSQAKHLQALHEVCSRYGEDATADEVRFEVFGPGNSRRRTPATMRALNGLLKLGLVTNQRDPDLRKPVWRLTTTGRQQLAPSPQRQETAP